MMKHSLRATHTRRQAAHANEGGEHEVRSTSKKVWVGVGEGYRSNNWSCGSVHGMLLSDARGFVEEA